MTTVAPLDRERLLDPDEVGERLGASGHTVRNWAREGRFLPATYIGNLPRWREADVNAWIARRAVDPEQFEATIAKSMVPPPPRKRKSRD